ncbi:MAG: indolepyruvate ferredoxin oxidoreductase subunit alpha, partial [Planctomycetota bacterium]
MSRAPGHEVLQNAPGTRACLLGNVAIARGALEAGVQFFSCYPGTPASEIGDTIARVARDADITFEYSVNEKVAVEIAFAASLAGARSMCSMKHLGLNYANDPICTMPYVGVEGGMVIVSAGDPSAITSPNEQDQR